MWALIFNGRPAASDRPLRPRPGELPFFSLSSDDYPPFCSFLIFAVSILASGTILAKNIGNNNDPEDFAAFRLAAGSGLFQFI
jgi:hypothetical protein